MLNVASCPSGFRCTSSCSLRAAELTVIVQSSSLRNPSRSSGLVLLLLSCLVFGMVMITSPCSCWTSASVLKCFGTGWLTQPCFVLCFSLYFTVFLLVLRLLACRWLCPSACCWLCSSRFFSSFLSCSTMSAALRAHRRFDVLLAVLVPVLPLLRSSRYRSFCCGSVSDPLQRHFVVVYSFLDASPAPPTPLRSIAPFVIVGSR